MGWLGMLFVGAVVGCAAYAMSGGRGGRSAGLTWRAALLTAVVGAVCALLAKMLGNIVGWLVDGSTLEWLISISSAIIGSLVLTSNRIATKGAPR